MVRLYIYNSSDHCGLAARVAENCSSLPPRKTVSATVSPGLVWREGIEHDWPQGVTAWQTAAPLARLGQPEEVADACLFLASRMAGWITGIDLVMDGGISARSLF